MAQVLGLSEDTICDDAATSTIESWDSFNSLLLISEIERFFDVKFSMEEAESLKSIKTIEAALIKHGVKFNYDENS